MIEPNNIFEWEIKITKDMIDRNNHVNNVVYVQLMQDIAIMHSESTGGTEKVFSMDATWVARSHKIEYLAPAFLDDEIIISTWIENIKKVSSLRRYSFIKKTDSKILAKGETEWILVDTNSGRPKKIPDDLKELYPLSEEK